MSTERMDYVSFLVRMWREGTADQDASDTEASWIVQIERIPDGETEYFASLDQFFAFMEGQLSSMSPREP